MSFLDKHEHNISKASIDVLQTGFVQLCGLEVKLENELKAILEAKARFMVEIDLRLNKKSK